MKLFETKKYVEFLNEIKQQITASRIKTIRSVNRELIKLYWNIGRNIIDKQKKYNWGDAVVERLASDLKEEFKSSFGFSANNLWRIRNFYLAYKDNSKLAQLVQEIPWGQNIAIMQMVKDVKAREYYIRATVEMGWSRNVLLNQIKAGVYQLSLKQKQHNFARALPVHLTEQADESIKSVYNLDFLDIKKPVVERELESRLIEKLKRFMLELGKGFSFIGNQYRLTLGKNEYLIDLLFYNRILKSLVAIELKTGKFEPEYAGKMDFYLHILDEQVKLKDENSSIGIILCAEKDNIVVEYALRSTKKPIGVAEYHITNQLPKRLQGKLPAPEDLKSSLYEEL